ncbi:hypothetical protein V6Z11_A10G091300 [Gossypium hirsutum]
MLLSPPRHDNSKQLVTLRRLITRCWDITNCQPTLRQGEFFVSTWTLFWYILNHMLPIPYEANLYLKWCIMHTYIMHKTNSRTYLTIHLSIFKLPIQHSSHLATTNQPKLYQFIQSTFDL